MDIGVHLVCMESRSSMCSLFKPKLMCFRARSG